MTFNTYHVAGYAGPFALGATFLDLDYSALELKTLMSAASLELLKKGASKMAEAKPAVAVVDDTTVEIDPSKMSDQQIEEIVESYSVPTPKGWSSYSLEQKRSFLQSYAEENGDAQDAPEFTEQDGPYVAAAGSAAGEGLANDPNNPAAVTAIGDEPKTTSEAVDKSFKGSGMIQTTGNSKKAKKKGTAVAKADVVIEGEIIEKGDVIVSIVHEIENMDDKDLKDVVGKLYDTNDKNRFKLGGVLSVIMNKELYKPQTFNDFVEENYGIDWRSARYLIEVYKSIVNSKMSWEKAKEIGWTKIMKIGKVLTAENADNWIGLASTNTVKQLEKIIKNSIKPALTDASKSDDKPTVAKTFKLHDGQIEVVLAALEKAKSTSGTEVDSVALEYICNDFLGSYTPAQLLQAIGFDQAVEAMKSAYPSQFASAT